MPRPVSTPLSADWKLHDNTMTPTKGGLSYWRRNLPDGSYTISRRRPQGGPNERYCWELRGPEREPGVGYKLVAEGISPSSRQARRDADNYVQEHKGIKPVPGTMKVRAAR